MSSSTGTEQKGIFGTARKTKSSRASSATRSTMNTSTPPETVQPTKRATSVTRLHGDRMRNRAAAKETIGEPNTLSQNESLTMNDADELGEPWKRTSVSLLKTVNRVFSHGVEMSLKNKQQCEQNSTDKISIANKHILFNRS